MAEGYSRRAVAAQKLEGWRVTAAFLLSDFCASGGDGPHMRAIFAPIRAGDLPLCVRPDQ